MNRKSYQTICALALLITSFTQMGIVWAEPAVGAARIRLQLSCATSDADCFDTDTTTSQGDIDAMLTWIWNVRQPSSAAPLVVDIDGGNYALPVTQKFCDGVGRGHTAFHGSGQETTVLTGGVSVNACEKLSFQDMTIQSEFTGVAWTGGGSSVWAHVHVIGVNTGWADSNCGASKGVHYWFGSQIEVSSDSNNSIGYYAACDESWIYATDISVTHDYPAGFHYGANGVLSSSSADVRLFGSTVRVDGDSSGVVVSQIYGFGGLGVLYGGTIHMHGGIVSVKADKMSGPQNVFGASSIMYFGSEMGGLIHTPGTAFVVKAGPGGTAFRTQGAAVQSPFLWAKGNTPPSIKSTSGSDMFVESDCSSSGCQTAGSETHLLIYNASCTTDGPWFDSTLARCRGE